MFFYVITEKLFEVEVRLKSGRVGAGTLESGSPSDERSGNDAISSKGLRRPDWVQVQR